MTSRTRIVALGDSTTAGTPGWQSPLEAPPDGAGDVTSQYAYWLMHAHAGWEVLNRGVNGERTDQIAARFQRDVIDAGPAAVVVIAGVNDVYQGRPAEAVIAQLDAMYRCAVRARIPVVAGSIVPYDTATPGQNAAMHEINGWIRQRAADDPEVAFADTRAAAAMDGHPDRLADTADGLHPTSIGYRRMAEAIALALEQLLRSRG